MRQRNIINKRAGKPLQARTINEFELEQKRMAQETRARVDLIHHNRNLLEPMLQPIPDTRVAERYCTELLYSEDPSQRVAGLIMLSKSELLFDSLPYLTRSFFSEEDEEVKTNTIICVVDYLDGIWNFDLPKRIMRKRYQTVSNFFVDALEDPSDVVVDNALLAIGSTYNPDFSLLLKEYMWTDPNPCLRGTAAEALLEVSDITANNSIGRNLFMEFRRLHMEDKGVGMFLVNPLVNMGYETRDIYVKKGVISLLQGLQMEHRDNISIFRKVYEGIRRVLERF
jgi:hypothetical protein